MENDASMPKNSKIWSVCTTQSAWGSANMLEMSEACSELRFGSDSWIVLSISEMFPTAVPTQNRFAESVYRTNQPWIPAAQLKSLFWNSIFVTPFHAYPIADSHLNQDTQLSSICSNGIKKFDISMFRAVKAMAIMNAMSWLGVTVAAKWRTCESLLTHTQLIYVRRHYLNGNKRFHDKEC